jgi:hypothetical protein
MVSKGTSQNGALQLLAEQYKKRLERIHAALANISKPRTKLVTHDPDQYYKQAGPQ